MNTLIVRMLVLLFLTAPALHAQDCTTTTADAWQQRVNGTPPTARIHHTAVWTGSEMIVWGGDDNHGNTMNTGGRYNPAANSWTAVTTTGAPSARTSHTAVWTGSEMIVWGGVNAGPGVSATNLRTGGRYHPASNTWTAVSTTGAPSARGNHTAVWTGSEMIVWGGNSFSTGTYPIDGGRYNPASNSWAAVTTTDAPSARISHTAVWTGSEMIVWGGQGNTAPFLNDGARYQPVANSWTAVSATGAPSARYGHTVVWTGSEMIIWGGDDISTSLNTGGRYHAADNSWTAVTATGTPAARRGHTAVWTGSEMIVWGGFDHSATLLNTGGRYNPAGNSWTAMTTANAPSARHFHTAVWAGSEMIVWGGFGGGAANFNDTFSYTPGCGIFQITSAVLDHGNLILSFRVLTGRNYTLWRSDTLTDGTWTNTGLTASAGTGATLTFTIPAPGVLKRFFRVQADP